MKVKYPCGKISEVNDSYGERLIEQGKAIKLPTAEAKKPAPAPKAKAEKKG